MRRGSKKFSSDLYVKAVACAGFILAGAEKKIRGGRIAPEVCKKNSAPPAKFDSTPGAEPTRRGAEIKKGTLFSKT